MAVMVTSQRKMIWRIDIVADDTLSNVESGQEHLPKYFHYISSNRWLIVKVFAILIFFVFFIIFLELLGSAQCDLPPAEAPFCRWS
eukprot:2285220-Amphidinium_carterae.1